VKKGIVQTNGETVWIVPEANEYMTDGIFVNNDEPVPGVTESARMWPDGTISCNSCGSSRTQTKLLNAENGWIEVFCKKCGEVLFYNGA
jgi:RNase P subunit RPR2